MSSRRVRKPPSPRGASRIVWTARARDDLREIGDYIEADDPAWVAILIAAAESVATLPHAGRIVPEIGRNDVREAFKRTYRIVYRTGDKRIAILTVFEGRPRFPRDAMGEEEDREPCPAGRGWVPWGFAPNP